MCPEVPEKPFGYKFCSMFKTKEKATAYAEIFSIRKKCPVMITYNTDDQWWTVWAKTGKYGGKNLGRKIESAKGEK
jgi:hypothetical protein